MALAAVALTVTCSNAATLFSDAYFGELSRLPPERIDQMERESAKVIADQCERKWGTDYDMQLFCLRKEKAAAHMFYEFSKQVIAKLNEGDPKARVAARVSQECFHRWIGEFDMVVFCIREQLKAYEALQR